MRITSEEFGRIDLADVPLPDGVQDVTATYTPSGRVFLLYRTDAADADLYGIATVDDDGTGLTTIFTGRIPQKAKANGIRHMPFADNKRMLLGDYVLECTPDLDTCTSAELVDVEYPWGLEEDPLTSHHWSEIIVSPDDQYISWTILRSDMGAAAAWGRLRRTDDRYVIDDPVLISTTQEVLPDPEHPGYVVPAPSRGGEVKQFVRGGTAISAVGSAGGFLPDSVVQSLDSGDRLGVTHNPGYDETTIFSPDERLGLVMTSRASRHTDLAVLGLLPRPLANVAGGVAAWSAYWYAVTGVRAFRKGNVGPVLIDVERSARDRYYPGVSLHDPAEDWVYVSPMSWHPSGRKVMWIEMLRGTERPGALKTMRVRYATLLDHEPAEPVGVRPAPTTIPYGVTGAAAEEFLRTPSATEASYEVHGRHSGTATVERRAGDVHSGRPAWVSVSYHGFSDDGVAVYDGTESTTSSFVDGTVYTADLRLAGETKGEMQVRMSWEGIVHGGRLHLGPGEDGLPRSRGFARYGDVTLDVADLIE